MNLPKHKYLLTYRYAEIIQDLTLEFCNKYIDKRSRTHDQMVQASRSDKQCIIEAVGVSDTSRKGEIKLLGVSKGSVEELVGDYEDFLRQKGMPIYPKQSAKVGAFRAYVYRLSHLSNLSPLGYLKEKPVLPDNPTDAANLLLTLCHIESYLLTRQIISLERRFVESGGFTENLFRKRTSFRK